MEEQEPQLKASHDDQTRALEVLADPAVHGGALPERIDTHLSHVFLGPEYALKLKRALQFDFVDYGTEEKRHAYCLREVEANRAWASEIYLGVEPVWVLNGQHGVGNPPEAAQILDWVVRMVRFPDSARCDRLVENNALSGELIDGFADELAEIHRSSPAIHGVDLRAELDRLVRQIAHDIDRGCGNPELDQRIESWREAALTTLHSNTAIVVDRAAKGFIRRCHGDLHLKNLVLWDDRLIGFDALEFDPGLTDIDTLYDLAYTLMDLVHHKRRDLANRLLNRYLAVRDHYAGLELLQLYVSMRAGIRALAGFFAGQTKIPTAYFRLAEEAIAEYSGPVLLMIGGRSGSGKTTLARRIAPQLPGALGAVHIRSDVLRKTLLGVAPEEPLSSKHYMDAERLSVYAAMAKRCEKVVQSGSSCVLDATFLSSEAQEIAKALADKLAVPSARVWLDAPNEVLAQRLAERDADASDADLKVLRKQLSLPDPAGWTKVDVTRAPKESAAEVKTLCCNIVQA
ncbi:MAG: AAA family ATPase [Erythrobacter sp.]|nr:AAA family ATPase [Erythrobacter sp.]